MDTCKHEWERSEDGDKCQHCGVSWLEWTRGFASNVLPKKLRKLNG